MYIQGHFRLTNASASNSFTNGCEIFVFCVHYSAGENVLTDSNVSQHCTNISGQTRFQGLPGSDKLKWRTRRLPF